MNRRDFLRLAGLSIGVGAIPASSIWRSALAAIPGQTGPGPYGPLLPPDANGIMLPAGFTSRVIARGGETVGSTSYVWPVFPDGGAVFRAPKGGWIYVANTEWVPPTGGGVSAIRFDRRARIVDAYSICTGTIRNCAGGATPWGTWLTCEEYDAGHVWECQPRGGVPAARRDALGTFQHEAVAVDPKRRVLYLTEDLPDGRFYRFRPARWRRLAAGGILEVAEVGSEGRVIWRELPEANPGVGGVPTRLQIPASTPFRGGEGIAYSRNHVYFTTKGDNRVWDYNARLRRLTVFYDLALDAGMTLRGVDNVTVARSRDLIVAEDGGNMELVLLSPGGVASPLLRVIGQDGSELTGPAFGPGRRLYFSSQRGGTGSGITYEVSGPFRRRARD